MFDDSVYILLLFLVNMMLLLSMLICLLMVVVGWVLVIFEVRVMGVWYILLLVVVKR